MIGPYFPIDDHFALEWSNRRSRRETRLSGGQQLEEQQQEKKKATASSPAESLNAAALAPAALTTMTAKNPALPQALPSVTPQQTKEKKRGHIARALLKWLL